MITYFLMVLNNQLIGKGLLCEGICDVDRSPSNAMVGQTGMLRPSISDTLLMTSDQKFWMSGQSQRAWK